MPPIPATRTTRDAARALKLIRYDAKFLGENPEQIRPPIPKFTIRNGMMMVDGTGINHLLHLKPLIEILCIFCKDCHAMRSPARADLQCAERNKKKTIMTHDARARLLK